MNFKILAITLCLAIPGFAKDSVKDDIKKTGKDIGHGTRKVAKKVGHTTRDAAKDIGHGFRDAAKKVKKSANE